jgi:hypothetical protein
MARDFTLEDIGKVVNGAVIASESRIKDYVREYVDGRFNWLAEQMMKGFERIDFKINDVEHGLRKEMRQGFEKVDRRLKSLETNHNARLEILEEKVL